MFNKLPIDICRQVLRHLTISETWYLFLACGHTRKLFNKKVRDMLGARQETLMWLPVECNKREYTSVCTRHFDNTLIHPSKPQRWFCPYQHVKTTLTFRGDFVHCSGECPCCHKRTSFKSDSIELVRWWMDPPTHSMPTPRHVSDDVIVVGCYTPIPEEILLVGHVIDALDTTSEWLSGWWSLWKPSIIQSITSTHVRVRHLGGGGAETIKKTSARIAALGTHTNPWCERSGSCSQTKSLLESSWSRRGEPVFLRQLVRNKRCSYTLLNE